MKERIEWIEPEEATCERREQKRRELPALARFGLCLVALPMMAAALMAPLFGQDSFPWAMWTFRSLCGGLFGLSWAIWLQLNDSPNPCVLDSEAVCAKIGHISYKYLWKQIRSFNIADHPTLPGVRRLTLQDERASYKLQINFRTGQLDEAELSAFVEERIAEQRVGRLMRRVWRKL